VSERSDVVVAGGGHNGLVAAAYLARAGLRTVVLERRDEPGGTMALARTFGRLRHSVIRDLQLERHGLRLIQPEVRVFAPRADGPAFTLWGDPRLTSEELRSRSAADAEAFGSFDRKVRTLASFLAHVHAITPPDLKRPSPTDLRNGMDLVRMFHRLGERPGRELTRVLPMAVADFVNEAFETDAIRGAVAARGVRYTAMGPWSAGTTAVLLSDSVGADRGAAGESVFAAGGPETAAEAFASAARAAGAEVRLGAQVVHVLSDGDRAVGVALATGEELRARAVVSGLDPKRTLSLCDPMALGPSLVWRGSNIRTPGTVAAVDLELDAAPTFTGAEERRLEGRIVVGADSVDDLERAFDASKYGLVSERPLLEATIPTLVDPASDGRHRMHVLVQWTPYRLAESTWDAEREGLGDRVLKSLEEVAPGISDRVVSRTVRTPVDMESEFGLTEGHPLHGEPGLDQLFAWRPLLGHARYRFALRDLYLCGSGAHPGGGVTGAPGANAAREILADLRRG
jgi:phytoene dehydrogenase-like protein